MPWLNWKICITISYLGACLRSDCPTEWIRILVQLLFPPQPIWSSRLSLTLNKWSWALNKSFLVSWHTLAPISYAPKNREIQLVLLSSLILIIWDLIEEGSEMKNTPKSGPFFTSKQHGQYFWSKLDIPWLFLVKTWFYLDCSNMMLKNVSK